MTSLVMCDNCRRQAADHPDPAEWIAVTAAGMTYDFCSWECLLAFGARRWPETR